MQDLTDFEHFEPSGDWTNHGDYNPDRHGGHWVRWDGSEWELVRTTPAADVIAEYPNDSKAQYVEHQAVQARDLFPDGDPTNGYTDAAQRVLDSLSGWAYEEPVGLFVDGRITGFVATFADQRGSHRSELEDCDDWADYWDLIERYGVEPDPEDYPRE